MPELMDIRHTRVETKIRTYRITRAELRKLLREYLDTLDLDLEGCDVNIDWDLDYNDKVQGAMVTLVYEVEEDLTPKKQPIPGVK